MLIEGGDSKLYGSYQSCYYNIIEINDDILYKSKQILEKENNHNKTPMNPKKMLLRLTRISSFLKRNEALE